jgi:hypothetical protein
MSRRFRLHWADKTALLLALFIAGTAFLFWIVGIVGLDGRPHLRFDAAMIDWTTQAELTLVTSLWLFLRGLDFGAKALVRWLRSSLGRIRSGELRRPSYIGAGIRA